MVGILPKREPASVECPPLNTSYIEYALNQERRFIPLHLYDSWPAQSNQL